MPEQLAAPSPCEEEWKGPFVTKNIRATFSGEYICPRNGVNFKALPIIKSTLMCMASIGKLTEYFCYFVCSSETPNSPPLLGSQEFYSNF